MIEQCCNTLMPSAILTIAADLISQMYASDVLFFTLELHDEHFRPARGGLDKHDTRSDSSILSKLTTPTLITFMLKKRFQFKGIVCVNKFKRT